ncbi:hypothetical protein ACNA6I_01260 [Rossellomorea sp. FS2]
MSAVVSLAEVKRRKRRKEYEAACVAWYGNTIAIKSDRRASK